MAKGPVKIFEVRSKDWEQALSYEVENFSNGIFKVFSNCNPFIRNGNFQPTPAVTQLGSGTINASKVIRSILPVYVSGASQFYVLADDYKLYLVNPVTPSVTDVSAEIASGTAAAKSLGSWKGGLVYTVGTEVRFNAVPVASGSDKSILTGLSSSGQAPFVVGADRNGYVGNGNNVAKLIDTATATGNTLAVAASLETGFIVRQLINDGRYLVWLADNSAGGGRSSCVVAYWDMAKSVFDQIYEFEDSGISSAELVGDVIKVITPSGIYITNVATRPRLIVPFGGTVLNTESPTNHNASTVHQGNMVLWGTAKGSAEKVFAYGNKTSNKADRLFQPFSIASSVTISAVGSDNTNIIAATVVSGSVVLYSLTTGATNNTAIANVAGFSLPNVFSFHHARVSLRGAVASGNSVSLKLLNAGSAKTIKASETKTNSTDPGDKELIFDHVSAGDGSDVERFDEISDIELTTNVPIRALEVWGEVTDDRAKL